MGNGHTRFFHSSLDLANCHIDTNNFTPYNDAYGLSRGDEAICTFAPIMSNTRKESNE